MFELGWKPHHVARPHLLDGAALALNPAEPRMNQKGLAERMRVPGGARTRFEGHHRAVDACGLGRLKERINPHHPGEPFGRCLARRLISISIEILLAVAVGTAPAMVIALGAQIGTAPNTASMRRRVRIDSLKLLAAPLKCKALRAVD